MRVEGVNVDNAVGYIKLDPGVYEVEVTEGKEGVSKAKERKVEFTLSLIGNGDGKPHEKAGGLIGANFSLQPKALWKLRQFRDACKVPSSGGDYFDTDDFIGKRLKIATSVKDFTNDAGQTETRTQIDDFIAIS